MNDEDKFAQCVKMWLRIGELKARLQRENEVLRALLNPENVDSELTELKRLIKENEELKIKVNGS
jgi:hypothetical protein